MFKLQIRGLNYQFVANGNLNLIGTQDSNPGTMLMKLTYYHLKL